MTLACNVRYFCGVALLIFASTVMLCSMGFAIVVPYRATSKWTDDICRVVNSSYPANMCSCQKDHPSGSLDMNSRCLDPYPCLIVYVELMGNHSVAGRVVRLFRSWDDSYFNTGYRGKPPKSPRQYGRNVAVCARHEDQQLSECMRDKQKNQPWILVWQIASKREDQVPNLGGVDVCSSFRQDRKVDVVTPILHQLCTSWMIHTLHAKLKASTHPQTQHINTHIPNPTSRDRDRDRHRVDTVQSTTATSLQDYTNRPRDPPAISDRYNWLSSTIKVYTWQTGIALVVPEYLRVSSAVSKYKCRSGVATFTVDPDLIDYACGHTSLINDPPRVKTEASGRRIRINEFTLESDNGDTEDELEIDEDESDVKRFFTAMADASATERYIKRVGFCDGDKPSRTLEWLRAIDRLPEDIQVQIALQTAESTIHSSLRELKNAKWHKIKKLLANRFVNANFSEAQKEALDHLEQRPGEGLYNYITTFEILLNEAYQSLPLDQTSLIRTFLSGLCDREMARSVARKKLSTLPEVVKEMQDAPPKRCTSQYRYASMTLPKRRAHAHASRVKG
ncbi:hypothetical protein CAPTEDRAFT_186811 [Capitella teleta]|uniref:Retrotransposon gag domain-containing protein n=1 Tax=Capitella teleta TaxID=283909 RepID=R7T6N1_CAPTE|nr:hypothetical protein CAPTEDRAFT_186811 [Capitella teleta]|eukprot:ELT87025.1 hypothetical protein CAPTEDRAFT_186811 [Capitella teleta]